MTSADQGDAMRMCKVVVLFAVVGLVLAGGPATAQVKTLQGESEAVTVTVVALEQSSRTMTFRDDKGIYEILEAPPVMKAFDSLKVGDTITVRYYQNVVIRLKKPGEPAVDVDSAALTRGAGERPAGTAARQRTITATVTAMDPKTQAVTVSGPNGYVYSRQVADKKAFAQLKVGDRLDMTWTDALLISVASPKK
jgi:hypothetical protein